MKIYSKACLIIGVFLFAANCFSQGFVNLDFEGVIQPLNPVGFFVPTTKAIPGWTAYISGVPQSSIVYNTVPLADPEVTLQGTNNGLYPMVQGNYFAMLWGQFNFAQDTTSTNTAAIGQTAQIPGSAKSLTFWGTMGGMYVTFSGQTLNFIPIGSTGSYTIYGADISSYAGQTGQLLFTDSPYSNTYGGPGIIDNIQFSSSAVPEPSTFALAALGGLLLGWRRRK